MFKEINIPAVFALIIYPICLVSLGIYYGTHYEIGAYQILIAMIGYYGSNIAVGVGLHRLWSHNSFKTNKIVEFILMLMTAGTLQGPVLAWASDHYKHHTFTDKEQDPHSPLRNGGGVKGFLWAHVGWMLFGEPRFKSIDRVTLTKLGRNPLLRFQLKYYWELAIFMNLLLPMLIGFLIDNSFYSAFTWFLFIGLGRALQQQATFCVNSACHYLGSKKYYKGTAGDIWWMAIFLLGENWHNFHHAFPSDYRNGAKWYHFDVHKWIIYVMEKCSLATSLERTSDIRIQAKMKETAAYLESMRIQKLENLASKAKLIRESFQAKFTELENSSSLLKQNAYNSFVHLHASLKKMLDEIEYTIDMRKIPSEKWLKVIDSKLECLEYKFHKMFSGRLA